MGKAILIDMGTQLTQAQPHILTGIGVSILHPHSEHIVVTLVNSARHVGTLANVVFSC